MQNAKLVGNRPGQVAIGVVAAVLLVAAALLLVVRLPAEAQANDGDVGGVILTSPNPGELLIAWDAPGNAPDDYRVTWKRSTAKWPSYKNDNTVDGGNAFPTGTSHTVTGLEGGTEYSGRVRARYEGEKSGTWSSEATVTVMAGSTEGTGDGETASLPGQVTGLRVLLPGRRVMVEEGTWLGSSLTWEVPGDGTVTGYRIYRGDADGAADEYEVLAEDTGSTATQY